MSSPWLWPLPPAFFSFTSTIAHSVVSRRLATLAVFGGATHSTFVSTMMQAVTKSQESLVGFEAGARADDTTEMAEAEDPRRQLVHPRPIRLRAIRMSRVDQWPTNLLQRSFNAAIDGTKLVSLQIATPLANPYSASTSRET
jgi:hypothetical protein